MMIVVMVQMKLQNALISNVVKDGLDVPLLTGSEMMELMQKNDLNMNAKFFYNNFHPELGMFKLN